MERVSTTYSPHDGASICHAALWFLEGKDLYLTVKPYSLRFASPNPSVPRENLVFKKVNDIPIHDVRRVGPIDFDRTGFAFIELESPLTYHDCVDRKVVEELLLKDVKLALSKWFKTPNVVILDHTVGTQHHIC